MGYDLGDGGGIERGCVSFSVQIDSVELPTWQAQLKGKKTWTLAPPPECEKTCAIFNVTVNTGDMSEADGMNLNP